ncbi:glycosyltransferase family protein [Celerinatantimonas diazotrophica]|uniref:Glucosyl-3-phosphoglycerate synthase n=1 Tax=Celerinatantimonas diazotrophica TaxID=412034 RepID=A0A4R1JLV9_9GAMM|nr:glycosyl transferase [Celerinatantimonas diazotrophica]TCK51930.1 glucosyl-3-phosphoglycerate synthase [Celerinatantimonas diazotrophica]CAG9296373.1 Glucosyl-3-phosphoglycerate synthase [Celerinatantimonas diazotrophica]
MADFYQSGLITTLHNLTRRPVKQLEQELVSFSRIRPMTLILPSLFSELQRPALAQIVEELKHVPYLSEIVIGLDNATRDEYLYAKEFFSVLPQRVRILWNDGPRLRELDHQLATAQLAPQEAGKGRNVWYCIGYVLASGQGKAVALHDCDIVTYSRDMLARLFYPVANPHFSYQFCKGYYARHADGKLNGRVARLLVTPLIKALKKIEGYDDYLEYMDSFRYALAGEFSMQTNVLRDLRIPFDWGLEIGVLSEVYRNYSTNRICQVDIADIYDHKHQDLSVGNFDNGLAKMATDISKAVIRKLATQGHVFSPGKLRTLKATYYRMALDFIDNYYNDALMNGLTVARHAEEEAVELFAQAIMRAGDIFLERPSETPFIPSWNRVTSAIPEMLEKIYDAVEADNS